MSDTEYPENSLMGHLLELRQRLLRIIIAVLVVFVCLAYFANDIYELVSKPLTDILPSDTPMIAKDVTAPLMAPFKLTFMLSLYLAIPVVLHQIWSFIAPGLYNHEKRLIVPLLVSSTLLFYGGIAFVYFVVFPLIFKFFSSVGPAIMVYTPDISSYLNFILTLFFAFGVAFEIPVVILILCWAGITNAENLRKKRPYIVVGAFVLGMFLTPPDVISQTLLAIPMWLLFELGLLFAGFYTKKDEDEQELNSENSSENTIEKP